MITTKKRPQSKFKLVRQWQDRIGTHYQSKGEGLERRVTVMRESEHETVSIPVERVKYSKVIAHDTKDGQHSTTTITSTTKYHPEVHGKHPVRKTTIHTLQEGKARAQRADHAADFVTGIIESSVVESELGKKPKKPLTLTRKIKKL